MWFMTWAMFIRLQMEGTGLKLGGNSWNWSYKKRLFVFPDTACPNEHVASVFFPSLFPSGHVDSVVGGWELWPGPQLPGEGRLRWDLGENLSGNPTFLLCLRVSIRWRWNILNSIVLWLEAQNPLIMKYNYMFSTHLMWDNWIFYISKYGLKVSACMFMYN